MDACQLSWFTHILRGCLTLASAWWHHQMETFSVLLALCMVNSLATGQFPSQRPVTRSFDVFFDLRLNKRLSKQSWGWWFGTIHYDVTVMWAIVQLTSVVTLNYMGKISQEPITNHVNQSLLGYIIHEWYRVGHCWGILYMNDIE